MTGQPQPNVLADVVEPDTDDTTEPGALEVFRNRPFLLLWLSQAFTQIGGNMVIYGLTVIILETTRSNTAVSLLILTFLLPAVLFSAVAGVYVDRLDKRQVLIVTNILRFGAFIALYLVGDNLPAILLLNMVISSITVFFAPAEAAMIPQVVPRKQLTAANGVFTLTLNAAFAIGFALLGPVVVTLAGAPGLILIVAFCYLVAAGFCWTLPPSPPIRVAGEGSDSMTHDAEAAMGSTFAQLREGIAFIRSNPKISWSLMYLAIAASLVGVLGVIGPNFARDALLLEPKDFVVIVLPLGFGIVMGILLLNNYGHHFRRRRIIEVGLVSLGILLMMLSSAGPISRLLQRAETATGLSSLADFTSLLAIVVLIALLAGVAYALVAIPSQTQLQEDIPEEARGRVFGILNMLVSVASFLPIIIVGPVADLVGNTTVLFLVGTAVLASGILSIVTRGPLKPIEAHATAHGPAQPAGFDPVAVATAAEIEAGGRRSSSRSSAAAAGLLEETPPGNADGTGEPLATGEDPVAGEGRPDVTSATADEVADASTDAS
jgi:MFS family permease